MRIDPDIRDHVVASFFDAMSRFLDEKQLRLAAGAFAFAFGEGSANAVATAAALSRSTVVAGIRGLTDQETPVDRIRRAGAGRRGIEEAYPEVWEALDALRNAGIR